MRFSQVVIKPSGEIADIQLIVERCVQDLETKSEETRCANVSFIGDLEIGTK